MYLYHNFVSVHRFCNLKVEKDVMEKNAIGGLLESSCTKC